MLPARDTFIEGTGDGTVTESRHCTKRTAENMSEDLLNRQIQDYGLVSPERAKNLVWSYFKKYGSKNLSRQTSSLHSEIGQRQFTVFDQASPEASGHRKHEEVGKAVELRRRLCGRCLREIGLA